MRELKGKIKNHEIVVFKSDKCGKLTIDTTENYLEALKVHTESHEKIDLETASKIEGKMNEHLAHFNKMFQVGAAHSHEVRVTKASTSSNILPPPLYGFRKTHKKDQNGSSGPALRPVCGAKEAPNSRFSSFYSKIIYDLADTVNDSRECKSSEEMRAAFREFNTNVDENVRNRVQIYSMDVKSLYPSLRKSVCKDAAKWLVNKSGVSVENVDWTQVTRYLAVNMTPEEIDKEGVADVIPGRVKKTRRQLTMHSLYVNTADKDWLPSKTPSEDQKRILLGLVMAIGIDTIMSNHTFMLGDDVFLQSEGGPIGLEATGAIARAVMMWYDELYLEKVETEGYKLPLYERYIDDSNQGVVVEDGDVIEDVAIKLKACILGCDGVLIFK